MKPVHWIGSSREDLKAFPKDVRREIGFALQAAQSGDKHPSAKPLRGFGDAGVLEIVENRGGLPAMAKRQRSVTAKAAANIPVTRGSGNVFADLGFEDAEELQVKA